jgi:hypothetical protein
VSQIGTGLSMLVAAMREKGRRHVLFSANGDCSALTEIVQR